MVGASLAGFDRNLIRAARALGASPRTAFVRITFPLVRNGIIAGGAFAAIVSLNDVDIAVFMQSPTTMTLPVQVYATVEQDYTPLVPAVSSIAIVAVLILLGIVLKALGMRAVHDMK
jgi:putative spermidine/putrescine transport system permease protein